MMPVKETLFTKDAANKKMKVVREFDAPLEQVWKAWTDPAILDQWWAPKPWKAVTTDMDFRDGGSWKYYMAGPDEACHYCVVNYDKIIPEKSFSGVDAFADEKGNINTEMPTMNWYCAFSPSEGGTKVEVEITFKSEADMKTIVEMGFQEGFAAAHANLDEVLQSLK